MRWEMEMEMEIDEVEAVLETIWDLHDKISDVIHAISRSHFLNSIKTLTKSETKKRNHHFESLEGDDNDDKGQGGFVFVKDFRAADYDEAAAVAEARSLNAIRTALENLEDQLEFFHLKWLNQVSVEDLNWREIKVPGYLDTFLDEIVSVDNGPNLSAYSILGQPSISRGFGM